MESPMAITKIPILAMDLFPAQMGLLIKWLAQQDFVIMQRRTNVTGPETYHVVSLLIYFLILLFYITCIRSILENACPVFHRALPGYLSEDLERLQKRALRIIYPSMSYNQALEFSGLPTPL